MTGCEYDGICRGASVSVSGGESGGERGKNKAPAFVLLYSAFVRAHAFVLQPTVATAAKIKSKELTGSQLLLLLILMGWLC